MGLEEEDWGKFEKLLMKEYKREDVNQQRQTRRYLEKFCSIRREEDDRGLEDCYRQVLAVSLILQFKGQIDEYLRTRLFLTVIRAQAIDPKDSETTEFRPVFEKTLTLLETKETMEFFSENALQKKGIEKLVHTVRDFQDGELDFDVDPLTLAKPATDPSMEALAK